MLIPFVLLGLGCSGPSGPESLPAAQQLSMLVGPVAHAWRDLARAQPDAAAAAAQYRVLAATLKALPLAEPRNQAWRDLLVQAAERDAVWGEAIAQGAPVPQSSVGPVSVLRGLAMTGGPRGQVTANASLLLQDPPWKNWDAQLTPWLETAALVLDAAPPFHVDAHWGPWEPRDANRQIAGLASAEQGRSSPHAFVARLQATSGPAVPRGATCDLYQDLGGEGGPPDPIGQGPTQAHAAGDLLVALAEQDHERALAAIPVVVSSRSPRCPGAAVFEAGLTGRLLLSQGEPAARIRLEEAVAAGRGLLSAAVGALADGEP